jgi:hypothetical protein
LEWLFKLRKSSGKWIEIVQNAIYYNYDCENRIFKLEFFKNVIASGGIYTHLNGVNEPDAKQRMAQMPLPQLLPSIEQLNFCHRISR